MRTEFPEIGEVWPIYNLFLGEKDSEFDKYITEVFKDKLKEGISKIQIVIGAKDISVEEAQRVIDKGVEVEGGRAKISSNLIPGASVTALQIMKLAEYGNEEQPAIGLFTKVVGDIRKDLLKYWMSYSAR